MISQKYQYRGYEVTIDFQHSFFPSRTEFKTWFQSAEIPCPVTVGSYASLQSARLQVEQEINKWVA